MSAMTRLYRKDQRVYRAALVGGLVLLLMPYVLAAIDVVTSDGNSAGGPSRTLMDAAFLGMALTILTAAVFGAAAFAAERRDGTADFLALVPVSRLRVARSKLRAALSFLLAAWAVHASLMVLAGIAGAGHGARVADILWNTSSVTVMVFGVAWLMSSYLSSPAVAASFAVAVTVVTLVLAIDVGRPPEDAYHLLGAISFITGSARVDPARQWVVRIVMWTLGGVAWLAGTAVYVRRVTP